MAKMIKKVYAECQCYQKDHVLLFELDTDQTKDKSGIPYDPEIEVFPILNPERSFWKRVWIGFRYMVKPHAHKYDYFDNVVLKQEAILQIVRLAELYGWLKAVRQAKRVRVERDKLKEKD